MRCIILAPMLFLAGPALANTSGCGENAYSFAEVVGAQPAIAPKV